MNRDDVIRWAREAAIPYDPWPDSAYNKNIERFAAAAFAAGAAAERNCTWTQENWTQYERSIAAAEREALARFFEDHWRETWTDLQIAEVIRARGNT